MKTRFFIFITIFVLLTSADNLLAQDDTVIGQISSSPSSSFTGGISGDGRLVVFESTGNVATENPRNEDGNREIFVFDYAQRRIFQITDTKSVISDPNLPRIGLNTRVTIDNTRPVISNDGKWIAFTSNATTSVAGSPVDGTNPGNFDGDSFTNATQGADSLELVDAEGGETMQNIVQPTAPSLVRIQLTDLNESISAFSVTVAGTDMGGGTISETFTFADGLEQVGTLMFATVSSVTLDSISGNSTGDFLGFSYGDGSNPLTLDGNTEMWLFGFQNTVPTVDLSQGAEVPFADLSTGTFTQITNTPASRLPVAGTFSQPPIIANDNTDASISDDGNAIAFVSSRNLVGTGNEPPENNPEIFTYIRSSQTTSQVTETIRGPIFEPRSNNVPTISGNGMRVMFTSNANNPIVGMTGGDNTDLNQEIFYADLNASGAPSGTNKQVTTTSPDDPGVVVNLVNFGRRMSRDGRYIAFDSFADLTNEFNGENQVEFGTFLYDAVADTFTRIGERSNADADAPGGDVARYPTFTDYVGTTPQTIVMETRMNITADGTIAAEKEDGLNPIPERPSQIYSYPIGAPTGSASFRRITLLPPPPFQLASIQIYTSNTLERTALTIPGSEVGTGNPDFNAESYYMVKPDVITESPASLTFETGATRIPITNDPVPAPSVTPSPTPQSPPAAQGLSRGSLATVKFDTGINQPVVARTAVGDIDRRFMLPMELGGVTMSINGVTVGLKRVSQRSITFTVPFGLGVNFDIPFPVVINNNGIEIKGDLILVPARPDIFIFEENPSANRARILNVVNRVQTREPFDVRTLMYRGGVKVRTRLRMFLTGVDGIPSNNISIRFGETPAAPPTTISNPVMIEPGIYYIDFDLLEAVEGVGDQPVVIEINLGEFTFLGRLDSDAPRVRIL